MNINRKIRLIFSSLAKMMSLKFQFINHVYIKGFVLFEKKVNLMTQSKMNRISLSKGCYFRTGVEIDANDNGSVYIGENVFLNRNIIIVSKKNVYIGNNVTIGPNVVIYDHDHDISNNDGDYICESISIGDNTWIGANSIILKGSIIEENVVIGAGSFVNGTIKKNSVYYNSKERVEYKNEMYSEKI